MIKLERHKSIHRFSTRYWQTTVIKKMTNTTIIPRLGVGGVLIKLLHYFNTLEKPYECKVLPDFYVVVSSTPDLTIFFKWLACIKPSQTFNLVFTETVIPLLYYLPVSVYLQCVYILSWNHWNHHMNCQKWLSSLSYCWT